MMTRTHMCVLGGLAGIAAIGVTGAAATPSQTSGFVIRETTRTVLVLRLLRPQITLATARGHAVLLPRRIRPGLRPVHGEGSSTATGYIFTIAGGPPSFRCLGANACTLVTFEAHPEQPLVGTRVRLARGRVGAYTPMHCGASCADPSLSWNERGMTYTIWGAIGTPRHMKIPLVAAANAAIVAGPR
jgi:hypothetical protein